ncbi:thiamine pyrophosphate-dependent enzyme [Thermoflexus sp.]|uniref:thiamine pyrophosphate-dependent enzyme n=1 Tax=Thermoflexus sp. TaxID=1969742 RepID=UPI002ADD7BB4|nr:thiamine pyrophosphate-dependent enzyme [Thermoflexus sp.]
MAATPLNLKVLSEKPTPLSGGHRMCAGCAEAIIVKQVLLAIDDPVVVINGTGCLEVSTTIFPYTAWRVPWIHVAFENTAAVAAGVEAAYRALIRRGGFPADRRVVFVAFAGDGGTYDIGLQALSGALERGHKFLYVCLDNEGYMNTGIQRSSATPRGAWTTTTPVGAVMPGKLQWRKDLTGIIAAHRIPYVAQAAPTHWKDLMSKVRKAIAVDGPAFLNVLADCNRGWRHDPALTLEVTRMAIETCYWPLFEVEDGVWRLNYRPRRKLSIVEYLKLQGRFAHLLRPEHQDLVAEIQAEVDRRWEELLRRCGEPV